jgi:hypothetical protein
MTELRSLLLFVGIVFCGAAHAATLEVDVLDDRITAQKCSLRTAIMAINDGQDTGGCSNTVAAPFGTDDTIRFARGLRGSIMLSEGRLEVESPVHIMGPGRDVLTITKPSDDQDFDTWYGVFRFNHAGTSVVSGLTISGGLNLAKGGGILSSADLLEVRDSAIVGNRSSGGGGIFLGTGSDLRLVRSIVAHNSTDFGSDGPSPNYRTGGGILAREGHIEIVESEVTNNQSRSSRATGAGIDIEAGSLLLQDSLVAHNFGHGNDFTAAQHGQGGGVRVSGDATVIRSVIRNNGLEGYNMRGGGIYVSHGCLTMTDSEVRQNSTSTELSSGGGIYLAANCAQLIVDSIIANNYAGGGSSHGGGIYNSSGLLLLLRTSVVDNWADALTGSGEPSHGGGIRSVGPVTLINSTLARNQVFFASRGGGLYLARDLTLIHSTVATNSAFDVEGEDDIAFSAEEYDFFAHGSLFVREPVFNPFTLEMDLGISCGVPITEGGLNLATDSSCGTNHLIGQAPVALEALALEPLGPFGDAHGYRALNAGSVAIGAAGDCMTGWGIADDQRGLPRPGGDSLACDVGAYEVQQGEALGEFIFADGFEG